MLAAAPADLRPAREMTVRLIAACLLALTLAPAPADAAPKAKVLLLQPLVDELTPAGVDGAFSKEQERAIKRSEACLQQDGNWLRAQRDEVPVGQIYELVGGAVVCYQGAEKKVTEAGEAAAPILAWTVARRHYIESFRSYLWALDAKLSGDKRHVCQRLKEAEHEGVAAAGAADGLVDRYEKAPAKTLAAQLMADVKGLNEAILAEVKNQRCE